jgi:hypothetical protein
MKMIRLIPVAANAMALVSGLACMTRAVTAETVRLNSLDVTQMTAGWSNVKVDQGVAGKPMSISGRKFAHGLGTHAASKMRLDLGGKAKGFSALVGVDHGSGGASSLRIPPRGYAQFRIGFQSRR